MASDDAQPRKCLGKDCPNDATTLQCPTCQKLGKESYFCSQDCFKKNWVILNTALASCQRGLTVCLE